MDSDLEKRLAGLCRSAFGKLPISTTALGSSGSQRRYFRLSLDGGSVLACFSENIAENKTFIDLAGYLSGSGIPVPTIFAVEPSFELYLLEDLGDKDFLSVIKNRENNNEEFWKLCRLTIDSLVSFQFLPQNSWKEIVGFPPLGADLIRGDFNYAAENLVKPSGIVYDRDRLAKEFSYLQTRLLSYPRNLWGLMFRDFQSRNIMISPTPYFIDFQSARLGPGIYDVVSFAWQAKAAFTPQERSAIVEHYCRAVRERGAENVERIKEEIPYWASFRIIQTLGAYGLRGLKEGKKHFVESIPQAVGNLYELLTTTDLGNEMKVLLEIVISLKNIYRDGRQPTIAAS